MIQDIYPSKLDNAFIKTELGNDDIVLVFDSDGKVMVREDCEKDSEFVFLRGKDVDKEKTVYLFSVDETRFFLYVGDDSVEDELLGKNEAGANAGENGSGANTDENGRGAKSGFAHYTIREVREKFSGKEVFAVFTAYHLWKWYSDNKYCGKCGKALSFGENERALVCPECGNVVYPRINPAVIVGVKKGDSLLLTKYRTGYGHNALVAGFTEIGETLEETVAREVMEETGVKVKNISYYKSQPWGMAQDILTGFFCEADGDGEIHMDENELKYAEWVKREDIVLQPNNLSLTNEMMRVFKERTIE